MAERTFGWIQDSGSFSNLKKILKAMQINSAFNRDLQQKILIFVPDRYRKQELFNALDNEEFLYNDLKGKGVSCQLTVEENMRMFGYSEVEATKIVAKGGRGNAACSGVGQLCLTAQKNLPNGQKKPYQGDWQADGFIRLGISLGFITYYTVKDTCKLSDLGVEFVNTIDESQEEKDIIGKALLTYPPACRFLELLAKNEHMTKFEIGSQLGFTGEAGFTSIPQNIFVSGYCMESDPAEKIKIRQNTEGTSDKYARMIGAWFKSIGWVSEVAKEVTETFAGVTYSMSIGQSYVLTLKGRQNLKGILGSSSVSGSEKIVWRDMLATCASDRDYLRNRRAFILNCLSNPKTLEQVQEYLKSKGYDEDIVTIEDDIKNFENIGLHIKFDGIKYKLLDTIVNLEIPKQFTAQKSNSLIEKDSIRRRLHNVDHKYLILMDLAYDSNANRDFEIETMALLTEQLQYRGTHLGGASKPDGVFYYENDGVIVDTKAYSQGYSLPLSQADEMIRYIEENKSRGNINPNEWWKAFSDRPNKFSYLFVSSEFTGGYQDRIDYIKRRTDYDGGIITAENLLLFAEKVMSREISYPDSFNTLRQNKQIEFAL